MAGVIRMKKSNLLFFSLLSSFLVVACSTNSIDDSSGQSDDPGSSSSEPTPTPTPEPYNPEKNVHYLHYAATEPTCTNFGNYECWIKDNGSIRLNKPTSENIEEGNPSDLPNVSVKEYYIAPLGHNLVFENYIWSSNYTSAKAHCHCDRQGCDHVGNHDATVVENVITPPTCSAPGSHTYTATFQDENPETTDPMVMPQLDHDYIFNSFVWNTSDPNNVTAQAKYVCKNGCEATAYYDAVVNSKGHTQEKTCYQDETTLYHAVYLSNSEDNPVVTDECTGHLGAIQHVDGIDATCSTYGNIEYWHCPTCDDYFSDSSLETRLPGGLEDTVLDKNDDHDWAYEFNLPLDKATLTARRVCKRDSSHVQVPHVTVTPEDKGTYILYKYSFDIAGFTFADQEYIKPVPHTHTLDEAIPLDPATCDHVGHVAYYTCEGCSKIFSDENLENEITSENDFYIPKTAHTPADPVIENAEAPTCVDAGSHDSVVYCSVCHQEISRTPVVDPATGHAKVHYPETYSTCSTPGYEEHWYCTTCKKYFTSEACTPESEVDLEDITKPLEEHTLSWKHNETYHWQECSVCDYKSEMSVHTPGAATVEAGYTATCKIDGFHDLVSNCTVCGQETSREYVKDNALGHALKDNGLGWTNLDTVPTLGYNYECVRSGCDHVETNPIFVADESPLSSPSGNSFSPLANNMTTKSQNGDVNMYFVHSGNGVSFHNVTYLRVEHEGAFNNANDVILVKVDNGTGYQTSHRDGGDYFLIRSDYTASVDSNSGGFSNIQYGTNKSSFNADLFRSYMQKALIIVDVDYAVISKDQTTVTVTLTYYSMMNGAKAAGYLGYTQTFVATLGDDTDWDVWGLGTARTTRIARPATSDNSATTYYIDKIYHTDNLDHAICDMTTTGTHDGLIRSKNHHLGDLVAQVNPTCETDGVKAHYECSDHSGEYWLDESHYQEATAGELRIPALGHALEALRDGDDIIFHCKTCGKYFEDPECQHEIPAP